MKKKSLSVVHGEAPRVQQPGAWKASPLRAVVSNADAPAAWLCRQPALPSQL